MFIAFKFLLILFAFFSKTYILNNDSMQILRKIFNLNFKFNKRFCQGLRSYMFFILIKIWITIIPEFFKFQENEDMEWKFTRCQIYAEYFEWFTAIPPPFNLIYNTTCGMHRAFSNKFKFIYPVSMHSFLIQFIDYSMKYKF